MCFTANSISDNNPCAEFICLQCGRKGCFRHSHVSRQIHINGRILGTSQDSSHFLATTAVSWIYVFQRHGKSRVKCEWKTQHEVPKLRKKKKGAGGRKTLPADCGTLTAQTDLKKKKYKQLQQAILKGPYFELLKRVRSCHWHAKYEKWQLGWNESCRFCSTSYVREQTADSVIVDTNLRTRGLQVCWCKTVRVKHMKVTQKILQIAQKAL